MKIVLINAPDAQVHVQHATIIKQLMQELEVECVVLPPIENGFFKKQKQKRAIRELKPDVVIFLSPENILQIKGIRTIVVLTTANHILPKQMEVITDSGYINKDHAIDFFDDTIIEKDAQQIRDELTGGKEYFFYGGDINDQGQWERIFQAFSQFKKWQHSGLQLVLTGNIEPKYAPVFQQKFEAYKFRDDVICLNSIDVRKRKELVAAAFSVLSTAYFFEERMDIINAFHAGIPVIAANTGISKQVCAENVLYADFNNAKELSTQMIAVYKNEAMHNHLAEKGKLVSSRFSRQRMLSQLSRCLNPTNNELI